MAPLRKPKPRPRRRAAEQVAQAFAIASQMALLCPSGIEVWMQRELTGCSDWDRFDRRQGR